MKKLFITAAVALMSMSAMAQTVNYQVRWANHPEDAKHYTTDRLRKEFLVEKVFAPNEVNWTYTMYDRFLVGGAEPVDAPIKIEPIEPLLAKTFLENREIGLHTAHVCVSGHCVPYRTCLQLSDTHLQLACAYTCYTVDDELVDNTVVALCKRTSLDVLSLLQSDELCGE